MTYHLENSVHMQLDPCQEALDAFKINDWHNLDDLPEGMNLGMINIPGRLGNLTYPVLESIPVEERKVVLDAGCGTGLIGLHALKTGSQFVYFVEQDPQMFHILQNVLPRLLREDQYKLIGCDLEHLLEEWFDQGIPQLVTSELYGPTLFDEGYVRIVNCLKKLFPNATFLPEQFQQRVYVADVNYSDPIWPTDDTVLEHFKFLYESKGWNDRYGWFEAKEKVFVGNIVYNTQDESFKNSVMIEHSGKEKIIYVENYVNSHGYDYNHTIHGWYLPSTIENIEYEAYISLDEETLFRPMLRKKK